MNRIKKWLGKAYYVYNNATETFYIEKVSWFMVFPQILVFYDHDKNRLEAITFEWLFWSMSFGRWNKE